MAVRMREVLARPWVGVRMFHSLFSLVLTKTMFVNKSFRYVLFVKKDNKCNRKFKDLVVVYFKLSTEGIKSCESFIDTRK